VIPVYGQQNLKTASDASMGTKLIRMPDAGRGSRKARKSLRQIPEAVVIGSKR
jgi:hypothetical protein